MRLITREYGVHSRGSGSMHGPLGKFRFLRLSTSLLMHSDNNMKHRH